MNSFLLHKRNNYTARVQFIRAEAKDRDGEFFQQGSCYQHQQYYQSVGYRNTILKVKMVGVVYRWLPFTPVRVLAIFIILRLKNAADLAGMFAIIPAQNTNVLVASVS